MDDKELYLMIGNIEGTLNAVQDQLASIDKKVDGLRQPSTGT